MTFQTLVCLTILFVFGISGFIHSRNSPAQKHIRKITIIYYSCTICEVTYECNKWVSMYVQERVRVKEIYQNNKLIESCAAQAKWSRSPWAHACYWHIYFNSAAHCQSCLTNMWSIQADIHVIMIDWISLNMKLVAWGSEIVTSLAGGQDCSH